MGINVVVCGAGEVGTHIAALMSKTDNAVTLIDSDADRLAVLAELHDISTLTGSCTSGEVLITAGVPKADLVICCTDQDEINLLTAAISKSLGAKRAVARVEHRVFFEAGGLDYSEALRIDGMICPDYSTAQAIARVLRNPGATALENFGQDAIELQEFKISGEGPALGRPLAELGLPDGTRLAAVKRGRETFIPNGRSTIQIGDTVIMVGNTAVFQEARRKFQAEDRRHRQIVIMSGTPIAVWLCRELKNRHFSVRLFEPNRERAEELANKLDWVTVIQDDIVDPAVFEEEKVEQADYFVACGEDDEDNILSCVWAKSKGTSQVIAVSGRSDYLNLLKQIGIDYAFSPRNEAAEDIENFLPRPALRKLGSLSHGAIDVYRVPVGNSSTAIGQSIAQLGRESHYIIAAIRRQDESFVPAAADILLAGDTLLIVGEHRRESELARQFHAITD